MDEFQINCSIPNNVYIDKSPISNLGIFANKDFRKGELIYQNSAILVENDKLPSHFQLITAEKRYTLNKIDHLVPYNDNMSILYNFDSFTNHSCDPNTYCVG